VKSNVKKEMVSLRIPQPLNKQLTEYLAPKGITKNAFILGLINKELERAGRLKKRQSSSKQAATRY